MKPGRPHAVALAFAAALACVPSARGDPAYEAWLLRVGDYATLADEWRSDTTLSDGANAERLADLFLGPYARAAKARPFEGVHNLYRAALRGRRAAVLRLAEALDKGAYGLRKSPVAARCWAGMPSTFDDRLECVQLTEFRDENARLGCGDLPIARADGRPLDGVDAARICLAMKTPTLLAPGPPPGPDAARRGREYARHGIVLQITGDVYKDDYEVFREQFNRTTIEALDAAHGRGYVERLANEIEAR